jgi:cyanophycinase
MKQTGWRVAALMTVLLPAFGFAAKPTANDKVTYQYSRHGDADISNVKITPLVVLSGGGSEVAEAFQAMCIANNGGDFLVLGTSTFNKNYYSYIRNACVDAGKPANSVAILIVPDAAAANDPFVITTIANAEAIWIAGGDQSNYINYWSGGTTSVQYALNQKINSRAGVVIGGISAGMNILSDFVYTAQGTTTVTSTIALANPNSPSITLIRDFVEVAALHGLICDPHFVTRDRMGRDLAFLYRIYNHWGFVADGVGVDEATAVVISQDAKSHWTAEVLGIGKAYFLHPTVLPSVIASGSPLDGVTVEVIRVGATGAFDLTHWAPISGGSLYHVTATAGSLKSDQSNPANVY